MKLGLGLYPHIWNDAHLAMARQFGCQSVVAWMPLPAGDGVWHAEDLARIKADANRHDLELAAIENLPPAQWDRVLLGEEGREQQIRNLQQTVRNMGAAGIPCLGYYFSLVGVWGHWRDAHEPGPGRGGAGVRSFDVDKVPTEEPPIEQEMWGKGFLPHRSADRRLPPVDEETMWQRLEYFLRNLVPVAEEAGVTLAAHQDDPPVPKLRGIARLLYKVENLQRLLDLVPSERNQLEFCQGTVSEMAGVDVIGAIRRFAGQRKIAYVHFRNVSSQVPRFDEVFIDQGYVDMLAALRAYHECGFEGTLIPDHTPRVSTDAPWETGMAYALGYMRAGMQALGIR
jgi:mannonate dehydratase